MRNSHKRSSNKKKNPIVKIIGIILLLLVLVGIGGGFYVYSALQPVDSASQEQIQVEIPMGSSVNTIGETLEENGIIRNGRVFSLYTRMTGRGNFQAGTYLFSPSMERREIIALLIGGPVAQHTVTIPEGIQVVEIAEIIESNFDIPQEEFLQKINDETFLRSLQEQFPNLLTEEIFNEDLYYALEGYLFPSTYRFFQQEVTSEDLITAMIEQTAMVVEPYREQIEGKGFTIHQMLTLASIIEEEATEQSDRQTIASVFYNRMDIGMRLQTDPTVLYALREHKQRVLYDHLEVVSPFNTYLHAGLPPGPIANAGEASIIATLEPKDTEYLFFLADQYGRNYFSKTYEEHLRLREEHINSVWREQDSQNEE